MLHICHRYLNWFESLACWPCTPALWVVVIVPAGLNGNVSCVYHTHTHTVALWMLHVCMQRVKASYAILQWKCLFFRIASWYRRSWVPTVWLSYWVTYFPSGQHAVAIREYLLFPQSVDTKPRWMLRFVRLLSTGEIWNVLQTDVKRCTVALKSHLILQPCKVSYHSYSRRTL